jgi:hypothetical protein
MSRRAAAGRFGVSIYSVILRDAVRRARGSFAPKPQGGDVRSQQIEAQRQALLRKAAERPHEGLSNTIGPIADIFTQGERRNYFAAAGYDANSSGCALKRHGSLGPPLKPGLASKEIAVVGESNAQRMTRTASSSSRLSKWLFARGSSTWASGFLPAVVLANRAG